MAGGVREGRAKETPRALQPAPTRTRDYLRHFAGKCMYCIVREELSVPRTEQGEEAYSSRTVFKFSSRNA